MSKCKMVTKKFSSFFKSFSKGSRKRRTMRKKNKGRRTRNRRSVMKGG